MANAIENVLNDLGWNEGFRIPIANEENKRLEQEVERKSRERASLKAQLEALVERTRELRAHAADVRQEQAQNGRLLLAHSAQLEQERRAYSEAQIDESRLSAETRQWEKDSAAAQAKIDKLQANVNKLTKRLEEASNNVKIDRDRLLAWEEQLSRKEQKNLVIEQFVKSDEKTFKKIELERQTLSEKAEVYRQAVAKSVAVVNEMEMLLDRAARQYAQGMKERSQLMEQWHSSVQHLTQRDKSIYAVLQEINELREVAKQRMDEHREAEQFVLMQESENRELEESIRRAEREAVVVREEREKLVSAVESYSVQLHYRKKELQQLGRNIEDTRAKLKRKNNELANKRLKLQDCRSKMDEMRQTLKRIDGQKLNTEERLVQMRQMLEAEEGKKLDMVKETRRQQVLVLKSAERQAELEGELKVQRMQARAELRRGEQLAGERSSLEKSLRDTSERAYQADLTLQRTELRLDHLLGIERDAQALEAKHVKISQLQKQLDQRTDVLKTLQSQIAVVENQIRKVSATIASSNDELQHLQMKQHGLMKLIECGQKQLKAGQAAYEEKKVDENILQLRLRETDKIMSKVDDKLYDLEKYALQMNAAMQERSVEIKIQKESANLQKRVMLGECAEVRTMIAERRNRVQTLQARYDIHIACLGTNPEDGTPMTSAYLVIQSAQERYLLQERGDQLDRAIRKAEHEIRSMENTLKLVNMCNDKYKSSLSMVDENGPEKAEQKRLDQELFNCLELVSQKRQALERAQQDCQRMEANCEQLDKDIDRIKEEKERKKEIVASLEQQITEQGEKLSRVDKNLRKILKDIQKKCICVSEETILLQERDIAVRELQELNCLALQRITEFTIRHVEAEAYVKKLLAERNISIPSSFFVCKQPPTPLSTSRRSDASRASTRASSSDTSATSLVPFQPDFSDTCSVKCPKPAFGVTQRRGAFRRK